jgi:hypothetical protein
MSRVRADRYTNRAGTGSPTFSEGVNVVGISSLGITTVTGVGQTALTVNGDARITGVLTVGQGSVTIDGTSGNSSITGVTTVGVTSAYITSINDLNYPTAGPLSNRNLIINGSMQVAQRGTSSTSTGYRTVDRINSTYAQITQTQTQQSLTSGDPYDEGLRYFFRVQNTSVSSNSTAISEISYRIEGQDINQSGWNFKSGNSYLTVSFWVRSSLAGTYYFWLNSPETSAVGYYRIPFTLSSNTWTKITHSIPGNSGITIDNDNGTGLILYWIPYYGTDYTGSTALTEQWSDRTGNDYLPDFAQNWCNDASATFDITGVQLEVGTVATPFEHRSYGDELARCERYCQSFGPIYGIICHNYTTTNAVGQIKYKTSMRTNPTAYNLIAFDDAGVAYYSGSGTGRTLTSLTFNNARTSAAQILIQGTLGTAGNAGHLDLNASDALIIQAEL